MLASLYLEPRPCSLTGSAVCVSVCWWGRLGFDIGADPLVDEQCFGIDKGLFNVSAAVCPPGHAATVHCDGHAHRGSAEFPGAPRPAKDRGQVGGVEPQVSGVSEVSCSLSPLELLNVCLQAGQHTQRPEDGHFKLVLCNR